MMRATGVVKGAIDERGIGAMTGGAAHGGTWTGHRTTTGAKIVTAHAIATEV